MQCKTKHLQKIQDVLKLLPQDSLQLPPLPLSPSLMPAHTHPHHGQQPPRLSSPPPGPVHAQLHHGQLEPQMPAPPLATTNSQQHHGQRMLPSPTYSL